MSNQEEISSEGDLGSSPPNESAITVFQNPEVLAAVQSGLCSMIGVPSGYIQSLPKAVKRRIKALKNIQVECCKLEGKFYEEVHALECKYEALYKPHSEKRRDIINGEYEPTEEECQWESDEEDDDENEDGDEEDGDKKEKKEDASTLPSEMEEKAKLEDDDKIETEQLSEDTKGIPEFWLTAMKNVDLVGEMIQEHDEPILKHLTDIRIVFTGPDNNVNSTEYPQPTPMGFVLEFHFSPNAYFTNTVLTKSYKMKCEPDEDDPFSFEGPEIVSTTGCQIDWKKGKNITQKVVKKKQRRKGSGRGQTRFVSKTVKNDSFFNFFAPPDIPEDEADMDEETEALLAADFEIGHFMRERLIPRAVLYFTGEAMDDDDDDEFDEDEGGNMEDDDDDDDDDDPDYSPPKDGAKPQECKQQ